MSSTLRLTGGIDVGNGYVKGVIHNDDTAVLDRIDLPSAVMATPSASPRVPLDDASAADVMRATDPDFYNRLDAALSTPLIGDSDRRMFGRAALTSRGSKLTEFDVHQGHDSKAEQYLSKVLVLGVFAAKALRDHVRTHGVLPDHELRVNVRAGLALPISEYVTRRHAYAADFLGVTGDPAVHLVTIKNFSTPVSVRLRFVDVQVIAEGASAQFAITDHGEPLAAALLADLRSREPGLLEGITPADLVGVRNTIGIDIGEGTANFAVFGGGRFNPEASTTLGMGYGTVLLNAMERLEQAGLRFTSRKQLADFLQVTPSALQRSRHRRAVALVEPDIKYLVEAVASRFAEVLAATGEASEAVYVYGGGSGPIKEQLYPALRTVAGEVPVLYLDPAYSRHLNREGLYLAARNVAGRAAASPPAPRRSRAQVAV
ncbi:ParM/StbA family protein [Granulicoccus phenolivorans]|uniref:ParM/StbA family protein n=1 Tax=Granulicoccus phenolivorans TaxID=266854 RepID=UPI0004014A6A|nr:ParM/StbA family protein [Granulicoccus phenolivorans]